MNLTVEQRIENQYNASASQVLSEYAKQGKTSKEVAKILQCGVSNVRRIARKYNVRFNQPAPQPTIVQNRAFLARDINSLNFLSRNWYYAEAEVETA